MLEPNLVLKEGVLVSLGTLVGNTGNALTKHHRKRARDGWNEITLERYGREMKKSFLHLDENWGII